MQKAFGWETAQGGGSPGAGPQAGATVAGAAQGAQGLVHWMSVMAEHMDPAVQHYMSWNQDVSTQNKLHDLSRPPRSLITRNIFAIYRLCVIYFSKNYTKQIY